VVIVSVPESRERGLLKFRRRLPEMLAEYKEKEKRLERG